MLLRSYKAEGLLANPMGAQVVHSPTSSLQQVEEDCYQLTSENRRLKHLLKQVGILLNIKAYILAFQHCNGTSLI